MRKRLMLVMALVNIAIMCLGCGERMDRMDALNQRGESLRVGMSKPEVVRIMGHPDNRDNEYSWVWVDAETARQHHNSALTVEAAFQDARSVIYALEFDDSNNTLLCVNDRLAIIGKNGRKLRAGMDKSEVEKLVGQPDNHDSDRIWLWVNNKTRREWPKERITFANVSADIVRMVYHIEFDANGSLQDCLRDAFSNVPSLDANVAYLNEKVQIPNDVRGKFIWMFGVQAWPLELEPELAQSYGLPGEQRPILCERVFEVSPGTVPILENGDLIVKANGHDIRNMADFEKEMQPSLDKEQLEVTVKNSKCGQRNVIIYAWYKHKPSKVTRID